MCSYEASNRENEEKERNENEVKMIVSINNHEFQIMYRRDSHDVDSILVSAKQSIVLLSILLHSEELRI